MEPSARDQWLYILRCEGERLYVGTTGDLSTRFEQHWGGRGAAWTQKHAPIEAVLVQAGKTRIDEDATVKRLMLAHGVAAVRGGSYPQPTLAQSQLEALARELNHARGCCFQCGAEDHWVSECPGLRAPTPAIAVDPAPTCDRCGRTSHLVGACYARTHASGAELAPKPKAARRGPTPTATAPKKRVPTPATSEQRRPASATQGRLGPAPATPAQPGPAPATQEQPGANDRDSQSGFAETLERGCAQQ